MARNIDKHITVSGLFQHGAVVGGRTIVFCVSTHMSVFYAVTKDLPNDTECTTFHFFFLRCLSTAAGLSLDPNSS